MAICNKEHFKLLTTRFGIGLEFNYPKGKWTLKLIYILVGNEIFFNFTKDIFLLCFILIFF